MGQTISMVGSDHGIPYKSPPQLNSSKIDGLVKSLQGRHSHVRGNDTNGSVIFYEFIKIHYRYMVFM